MKDGHVIRGRTHIPLAASPEEELARQSMGPKATAQAEADRQQAAQDEIRRQRNSALDGIMGSLHEFSGAVNGALGNAVDIKADATEFTVKAGKHSFRAVRTTDYVNVTVDGSPFAEITYTPLPVPGSGRKEWDFRGQVHGHDRSGGAPSLKNPVLLIKNRFTQWSRECGLKKPE